MEFPREMLHRAKKSHRRVHPAYSAARWQLRSGNLSKSTPLGAFTPKSECWSRLSSTDFPNWCPPNLMARVFLAELIRLSSGESVQVCNSVRKSIPRVRAADTTGFPGEGGGQVEIQVLRTETEAVCNLAKARDHRSNFDRRSPNLGASA